MKVLVKNVIVFVRDKIRLKFCYSKDLEVDLSVYSTGLNTELADRVRNVFTALRFDNQTQLGGLHSEHKHSGDGDSSGNEHVGSICNWGWASVAFGIIGEVTGVQVDIAGVLTDSSSADATF